MRKIVFLFGLIFTACGDIGEVNIGKVDVNARLDAKADVDIDLSTLPNANDLESNRDDFEGALESLKKTEYFVKAPGLIEKLWECNARFIDIYRLGQNLKFYAAVYSDGTGEAIPDIWIWDDYFLHGVFTWDKCEECVGEALSFRYNSVAGTGLVYAMELRGKVLTFYNYNPSKVLGHEYEITTCKDITPVPEPVEKLPVPVSIDQTVGSYVITVSGKFKPSTCAEWTQKLLVTTTEDSISMTFNVKGADSPPVVTGLYLKEFILNGNVEKSLKNYKGEIVIETGAISFTGKIESLEEAISISGDLTTPYMSSHESIRGTCSYTVSGNKKSNAPTTEEESTPTTKEKVATVEPLIGMNYSQPLYILERTLLPKSFDLYQIKLSNETVWNFGIWSYFGWNNFNDVVICNGVMIDITSSSFTAYNTPAVQLGGVSYTGCTKEQKYSGVELLNSSTQIKLSNGSVWEASAISLFSTFAKDDVFIVTTSPHKLINVTRRTFQPSVTQVK